ncbi:MAG: DUF2723 domain-containing protein [Acidobacteria bacterium]|nr:DUF2723 domain-containing protein [Acidobacteriota bacterium]
MGTPDSPEARLPRSIVRRDGFLAVSVGLIAVAVYLRTLMPDVGGPEDSAKFQYVGAALGTAHPPGYPLHTLLSHGFSYLPIGTVAYRANLLSAVMGSVTVGFAVLLARAMGSSRVACAMGALGLAFGAGFWNYSVLAEVYTLGAALLLGIVYWLVRWRQTGRDRHLFVAAFFFALALGNHLSIVAIAPAIIIFLLLTDPRRTLRPRTFLPAIVIVASGFLQYTYIVHRTWNGSRYREASASNFPELVEVVRASRFNELVFAFGWKQFFDARLPEFGRLVRSEIGVGGVALAIIGLVIVWRRDWRVAALVTLAFTGLTGFVLNVGGDLRGFLVLPLALAAPVVAAGADAVRLMFARLPGRAWPVVGAMLLLIYPVSLARANFAANDWHGRTGDARFFRALFAQLPSPVALLPEDYIADSVVTYLQAAEGGDRLRTLIQPHYDPHSVRQMFASGTPVFALDARHSELAPRGFHFEPVDLSRALAANRFGKGEPPRRHAYRLVGFLTTIGFGDAAWHDITEAAGDGFVGVLVDNRQPFNARVILYAASAAPLRPMLLEQNRFGHGEPSIQVQAFDRADAGGRQALLSAMAADKLTDGALMTAGRHVTRIEQVVNDTGQYAAWAVSFAGEPRRVMGFAQLDQPHVLRALATSVPSSARTTQGR